MGIITAILLFIIGSVGAACHGDLSGFGAIAKFIALFGCLAFLMINPVLLIIVVIILVIIIICCSK